MQARVLLTISSLFNRAKWTQDPVPANDKNKRKVIFQNFDLRYSFGGEERKYDVKVGARKVANYQRHL
jgi:hypothetical protein